MLSLTILENSLKPTSLYILKKNYIKLSHQTKQRQETGFKKSTYFHIFIDLNVSRETNYKYRYLKKRKVKSNTSVVQIESKPMMVSRETSWITHYE